MKKSKEEKKIRNVVEAAHSIIILCDADGLVLVAPYPVVLLFEVKS